jgi:polyisoprenyl-phosphate glycosyltransferase
MVSLVIPVFNEESVLPLLHGSVLRVLETTGEDWEMIYVDDGSSDRSLKLLVGYQNSDARIRVVELTRNWGHQPALSAGLAVARGDAIVLMDADLQDPPEVINQLISAWKQGAEVVIARRKRRGETGLRGYLFPLFYRILGYLSDFPIPMNAGIFGLLDRRAVDVINRLSESNRYLPGLRAWVGFRNEVVWYDRSVRAAGEPKQSLPRLLRYGLDAIFSFSYKPLRLSLVLGVSTAVLAMLIALTFLICRLLRVGLFGQPVVVGYTSTIVAILFLGGVQLFCVGVLGEYIGRIYDEVKRRPLYLVRCIHETESRRVDLITPKAHGASENGHI